MSEETDAVRENNKQDIMIQNDNKNDCDSNGDESDTGSDIFMPGGITVKASEVNETSQNETEKVSEGDVTHDTNHKSDGDDEEEPLQRITKRRNLKIPLQSDDDDDSNSGCLEINTDDLPTQDSNTPIQGESTPVQDEDTPVQDEDKLIINDDLENESMEDRNIFNNTDLFIGSEEKNEKKTNEIEDNIDEKKKRNEEIDDPEDTPPYCENIENNLYLIDKKKSRSSKEVRRMICECPYEPDDPLFIGCDDDCLNRLLMIECNKGCPAGEFCTNRSFQNGCQYELEIIKAGRKGWGLRTKEPIQKGSFIIEYCGEVVDYDEFHKRTLQYDTEGMTHYYFMTLKTNEIIDATKKGCKSRFINHSCDPNCVTQKWTVNGFLRVGFFALRNIEAFEELCFDYQFQRYGEKPQDCFCGAENCRGVIGVEQKDTLPSYIEKIMSNSPSSKQKKRKKQMKEFFESELACELNELLGSKWELRESKQTLELLRLMVKVETLHERKELLKILQSSQDSSALKAFVRYKGLSLLWTWMVDAPSCKPKYKVEILKTLKHLPIPNKNELDDSKLSSIILKWAAPVTSNNTQEDSSSTPSKSISDDDSDSEGKKDSDQETKGDDGNASQDDSSKEEEKRNTKRLNSENSVEEGETVDTEDESKGKKSKKKSKLTKKLERMDSRNRDISSLSASLLENWKSLKEVFRIPKKPQTPDRRPKLDNDDSPLPDEKRSTVKTYTEASLQLTDSPNSTRTMVADSTYSSPPSQKKQRHIHKGVFLSRPFDESGSPRENMETLNEESKDSRRNGGKREWRKSPNNEERGKKKLSRSDSSDQFMTADSTNNGKDASPISNEDKWNDDRWRQGSRWSRNRERRRDNDNNNRGNWNDRDSENKGDNDRNRNWHNNKNWGRNRQWNDRNNRGNRNNNRGMNDIPEDNSNLSWRENTWNNPVQRQPQPFQNVNMNLSVRQNLPPNTLMVGNLPNQQRAPMFPPGNMMTQSNIFPNNVPRMFPPPPMPIVNPMLPTQIQQNSPLVSPMGQPPFNTMQPSTTTKPVNNGQYNSPVQPDVSALNVVNQLQLLLNAERLKQQANELGGSSNQGTPDVNRNSNTASPHRTSSTSPTRSKPIPSLPRHWKTATDSDGRLYYYHAITRETSWDPPVKRIDDDDVGDDDDDVVDLREITPPPKKSRKSHQPNSAQSPTRQSPRIAAADTTHHHGPRTPPGSKSSRHVSSHDIHKIREAFKTKLSSVVVNCLNAYQKVDCKQGRIKNPDDFKFLARKLTHGLVMKEIQRIKNEELLICNDSVKVKVKEYIRNYMKKFGAYYIRS